MATTARVVPEYLYSCKAAVSDGAEIQKRRWMDSKACAVSAFAEALFLTGFFLSVCCFVQKLELTPQKRGENRARSMQPQENIHARPYTYCTACSLNSGTGLELARAWRSQHYDVITRYIHHLLYGVATSRACMYLQARCALAWLGPIPIYRRIDIRMWSCDAWESSSRHCSRILYSYCFPCRSSLLPSILPPFGSERTTSAGFMFYKEINARGASFFVFSPLNSLYLLLLTKLHDCK